MRYGAKIIRMYRTGAEQACYTQECYQCNALQNQSLRVNTGRHQHSKNLLVSWLTPRWVSIESRESLLTNDNYQVSRYDPHWKPMYIQCLPCHIPVSISMLIKNRLQIQHCSVHCDCQNGYIQLGQSVHPADCWCQSRQVLILPSQKYHNDCVVFPGCPRLTRQATTAAPHHHWWHITILNWASIHTLMSIY